MKTRAYLAVLSALSVLTCTPLAHAKDAPEQQAQDSVETYIERIHAIDDAGPKLNAVIVEHDKAPPTNRMMGPLTGHAILVKDNIETREWPTTAGSLALKDNMTGRDAPLITGLRRAGAVILGKTNLSEWANIRSSQSSSGWSAVGGQTKNPYAIDRSPCGSSAGSGAAVAAGLAWAAIGTETDGSITCPSSLNGIVGFKPTVGMVSRTYIVPISVSQDTAGPMANSVADAALLLNAMAGTDPADPATAEADRHKVDFTKGLAKASLAGVRIGVLRKSVGTVYGEGKVFDQALADMKAAGATLVDIDWEPDPEMGKAEFQVLLYELRDGMGKYLKSLPGDPPARDLAGLIAFDKAHADTEMRWFGQETFEQAEKATDKAAYEQARATSLRLAGKDGIDMLLAKYNVSLLVAPTDGPAWPIDLVLGDHFADVGAGSLAAIAGYPHLTVPMGDVEGLPVGLSFIGAKWTDANVLEAGAAYERARTAVLAKPSFKRWGE